MSRLDNLIKEKYSNSTKYLQIGDICEVLTGGEAPVESIKTKNPDGEYVYPVYSNGVGDNAIWGYAKTYRVDRRAVTFSSIGTIGCPTLREPNFTPIIRLKVLYPNDRNLVTVEYIKYALENTEFESQKSSVPNINADMIKRIRIPVPPIEIQNEIVQILDNFAELTAELTAELSNRKKQYEYYRDLLLNFDKNEERERVKWVLLGDVAMVGRGKRVIRNELDDVGRYPVYQNSLKPLGYYSKTNCNAGTYVICAGAAGDVGYSYDNFWAADDCAYFMCSEDLDNRYLYHVLMNSQTYLKSNVRKASIPRISRLSIEKLKIPLPSRSIQEKIVRILDSFDKLTTDISEGLPAEIEARKKQYEYYRDKILYFEELTVNA